MLNIDSNKFQEILSSFEYPDNGDFQPAIASISIQIEKPDYNRILDILSDKKERFLFFSQPSFKQTILGFSVLEDLRNQSDSFSNGNSDTLAQLSKNFVSNHSADKVGPIPMVLGGLKFSPDSENNIWNDYSESDWFIPEFLLLNRAGKNFLTLNFKFTNVDEINIDRHLKKFAELIGDPENNSGRETTAGKFEIIPDENDFLNWSKKMEQALSRIKNRELSKIVLSRKVDIEIEQRPALSDLMNKLEKKYRDCYVFSYGSGNSIFIGASPEKLMHLVDGNLETDALAGSIPRGKDADEDSHFANELLHSEKNLAEQKAVVTFITNELKKFSNKIEFADKPVIKKLPNIQHLWTPVTARIGKSHSIIEILRALHPTPAVCGVPRKTAEKYIREIEGYDRGLYAGIIGWFNFSNEGEFCVGIRSALLKDNILHAFAGCGIVEGSDILSEFQEAELKLQPILSIFENEKIN